MFRSIIVVVILITLSSCGSITPAVIIMPTKHKAITMIDFNQAIDEVEDLTSESLQIKSILLPNNDFITVREAPELSSEEAAKNASVTGKPYYSGFVLERYSSDLKLLWSVPLDQLKYASAGHLFQNDKNTVCLISKGLSAHKAFTVTAEELLTSKVVAVTFDITSGNIIGSKELQSDRSITDVLIESSPDGSKICLYSFNTNSTNSKLRVYDQTLTLKGDFSIDKNSVLQKAMCVTDDGVVYLIDTYKSNVMVARYDYNTTSNPQELYIDLKTASPEDEADNILSILPHLINRESIEILAEYSDDKEPIGIALTNYDFAAKLSSVKTNFALTKNVAESTINQSDFDKYCLNNAYFLQGGEVIFLLEKKFTLQFTSKPLYLGEAPIYETVAALKFNSDGLFQWGRMIDRSKPLTTNSVESRPKNFYLYQTNETSAISTTYDNNLYIAHRDRTTSNEKGFAISKISLDNGVVSSLNIPFTFGNQGYSVFFERNKTIWSSDTSLVLFFKETIGYGNFGTMMKINLNQL